MKQQPKLLIELIPCERASDDEMYVEKDNEMYRELSRADISMQKFKTSCPVTRNYNFWI